MPKEKQFSAIKRLIFDRLIFAPPYLLIFLYYVAIVEVLSCLIFVSYVVTCVCVCVRACVCVCVSVFESVCEHMCVYIRLGNWPKAHTPPIVEENYTRIQFKATNNCTVQVHHVRGIQGSKR